MKARLSNMPVEKRNAMKRLGDMKIGKGGIAIMGMVLGFQDKKGGRKDRYETGAVISVMMLDVDNIERKSGVMRLNEHSGLPEVCCAVSVKEKKEMRSKDEVVKYVRANYADAVSESGKYKGTFTELANYWDPEKRDLVKNIWYPLRDELGNPLVLGLNIWRGDVPADLRPGMVITVPDCSFGHYVYIPKSKGPGGSTTTLDPVAQQAAISKAEKDAKNITSPTAPTGENIGNGMGGGGGNFEHENISKVSPVVRVSGDVNSGVFIDEQKTSEFEAFYSLVLRDRKRHQLRMPRNHNDNYCVMLSLGGYQNGLVHTKDFEEGPSNGSFQVFSYEKGDYEKSPKGMDPKKTEARESKRTIRMSVTQYSGKHLEDHDWPWYVETNAYWDLTFGTGITIHEKWLKFGPLLWEGVAVMTVDASGTLSNALNSTPGNLEEYTTSGQLDCWIKHIAWDIRGTCRNNGLLLPQNSKFAKLLYADVYATSTRDDGVKKIELDLGSLYNKSSQSRLNSLCDPHPLHKGNENMCDVVNVNEWKADGGKIISDPDREFYILPYIPVPHQLLQIEQVQLRNDRIEEFLKKCTLRLQSELSHDDDTLCDVLLGVKPMPVREQNTGPDDSRCPSDDFQLYTPDELAALAAIKDPKERAKALPGRNTPRIFKKTPATLGFDFQLYAIKKPIPQIDNASVVHDNNAVHENPVAVEPAAPKEPVTKKKKTK